ncbi:MAG: 30S ribosomal protein S8 [Candidatus Omnitrophota bacterium]|nr:30S ribosomal protein S8 [Candidatus Omnitrophota bacterium]
MNLTDPISNALTVIRNGSKAKKIKVDIPFSKMTEEIFNILKREKFIKDFKFIDDKKQGTLRVYLRYTKDEKSAIRNLSRISKPSLRIYVKKDEIPRVFGGLGIAILSTSRGIVTDTQAIEMQTGGEVLCYVW